MDYNELADNFLAIVTQPGEGGFSNKEYLALAREIRYTGFTKLNMTGVWGILFTEVWEHVPVAQEMLWDALATEHESWLYER